MQCSREKKEESSKLTREKEVFSSLDLRQYKDFLSSIDEPKNKILFLPPNQIENKPLMLPKERDSINLEMYLASVWKKIEENHVQSMLEDLESLKYVPVNIRREMAAKSLFLKRSFE